MIRLSKYLSQQGICSRREAEQFIRKGWIKVDGEIVQRLGTTISATNQVTIDPAVAEFQSSLLTILLHKPIGYVSSQPEKGYKPAMSLITKSRRYSNTEKVNGPDIKKWPIKNLAPAGRLDIDSSGLLVFTQDGRIAQQLISPDSLVEKEYLVRVNGTVTDKQIERLTHGIELDNVKLQRASVELLDNNYMKIILTEGRKRQIRRMCEFVGLRVEGLKRVRIGNVKLESLPSGRWRLLKSDESF